MASVAQRASVDLAILLAQRTARISVRALEAHPSKRLLDIPQWMFDAKVVCLIRSASSPVASCDNRLIHQVPIKPLLPQDRLCRLTCELCSWHEQIRGELGIVGQAALDIALE